MLENIKKLITSGDSFTAGYKLRDAETNCWASVLAKQLDVSLTNYGRQGMGNDYIFNSIIDHFLLNPEDKYNSLVVLGLTNFTRVEFFDRHLGLITTIPNKRRPSEIEGMFWKKHYDELHCYKNFLRHVLKIQSYFSQRKINYLMLDAFPFFPSKEVMDDILVKSMIMEIDMTRYLWFNDRSMSSISFPNSLEDGHPNIAGHKIIADTFYEAITDTVMPFINHSYAIPDSEKDKLLIPEWLKNL